MNLRLMILVLLSAATAFAADVVELPKEELAKESVLPVFDNPVSVRNRAVVTQDRLELGGFWGLALTEPIANVSKLGLALYYHSSEDNAWGLFYAKNFAGQSDYAKQLYDKYSLDFSRAPAPDYTLMGDYNLKMYYGKMSLSKKTVLHVSVFGSAALGLVKYVHKSYPAVAFGVGQKFYLSKQFALRFDLRLYAHQAPIPFLAGDTGQPGVRSDRPKPSYSDFQERMTYTTNLDLGAGYVF